MVFSRKSSGPCPPLSIDGEAIAFTDTFKFLGFHLASDLTVENHVTTVCNDVFMRLSMLRNSQQLTPKNLRLRLIKALILPKWLYCANLLIGMPRMSWNELERTFRASLRYILNIPRHESLTTHEHILFGCNLERYLEFRSCLFLFTLLRIQEPNYLFELIEFPTLQRNGRLKVAGATLYTEQRSSSFFAVGVMLWNSLSTELRTEKSAAKFKRNCLEYFSNIN